MRLVLEYTIGDGCTYHCDETIPFVYDSAEQAYVDFEEAAQKAFLSHSTFTFGGRTINSTHFFDDDGNYYPPEMYTIDEWFKDVEKS
jgi:hypothetical protein